MIKTILVFLLLSSLSAFSQEHDSVYQAIQSQAWKSWKQKDYAATLILYKQLLSLAGTGSERASIRYNIACLYSSLNDPDSAFSEIDDAVQSGFTDYDVMSNDRDFSALKTHFPERFSTALAKVKMAFDQARINQSPIAVMSFDNYIGNTDVANYAWDDYHHPKMDSLRRKYKLDEIVRKGTTEFEKMKLLLRWTSHRFEHHSSNLCKGRDALAILDQGERGAQFCCTEYANVLANCLVALGYPARTISLTWLGEGFRSPDAHMCVEAWSNQFQKWILLDGQNDAWWEHYGIPLSAQECRHLLVSGRDSEMTFVGQDKDVDYAGGKTYWVSHFYHLGIGNYYAYFDPVNQVKSRYCEYVDDEITPELYSRGMPDSPPLSSDYETIYPQLNQTTIRLKHINFQSASDSLHIVLNHTMPWFDRFMVRINGSEWKESSGDFVWMLEKGENTIEAKAVNLAGIEGKTSKIVLRDNIEGKH